MSEGQGEKWGGEDKCGGAGSPFMTIGYPPCPTGLHLSVQLLSCLGTLFWNVGRVNEAHLAQETLCSESLSLRISLHGIPLRLQEFPSYLGLVRERQGTVGLCGRQGWGGVLIKLPGQVA